MYTLMLQQLVEDLNSDVGSGGFYHFFYNSAGDRAAETVDALEMIGAPDAARTLKEAMAMLRGGDYMADREDRQALMDEMGANVHMFDALSHRYRAQLGDVRARLDQHVRRG